MIKEGSKISGETSAPKDFEQTLLLGNERIPTLENNEHHYVQEYPDDKYDDKVQKTRESMEVPSYVGKKFFNSNLIF